MNRYRTLRKLGDGFYGALSMAGKIDSREFGSGFVGGGGIRCFSTPKEDKRELL